MRQFETTPAPATPWESFLAILGEIGGTLLQVAIVLVSAVVVVWVLRLIIRRVVRRVVEGAKSRARVDDTQALERSPLASVRLVQRTRTLGSILQNIVNVTVVIVAILLIILILAGPQVMGSFTLLSAAIGAGLGFGAQNIVKDVLNGIFIVAEDQIGIGDVADLGLATGVVEYVSVRITQVRDVNGTLWFVRNGEITRIGNMSQGWSRAIIDLAVPVNADVDEVEQAMLDAARALAQEPKWRSRIIEEPEVWGLESVSGDVARELRMRLKRAIDGLGLTLPQMNSIMLSGLETAGRVRGANPPRTKPTPIAQPGVPDRPVWRAKRTSKKTDADSEASGEAEQ